MAEATTDRILDAAVICFQRDSIDNVTMSDIIVESGLARTTVYRYFPIKDDIISQVVLRDIDYLIQHLGSIRARHKDQGLERQQIEVLSFTIDEISNRPLLVELFSQDPMRISRLGLSSDRVAAYTERALRSTFEQIKTSGRLRRGVKLEDFADWCRRVIMSFVITPYHDQADPAKKRAYIQNFIAPSLMTGI